MVFFAALGRAQMLDLNTNSMSDVWEQIYNATTLDPNADADGDGFSNLKEALAGSNPSDPNSFPKISSSAYTTPAFSITIPCQLGKQYQLQSVTSIGSTNWIVETNVVARSGTNLTLTAPTDPAGKFFRTAVSDVDSDGDGLNDWEEYQMGLDPFNAFSNGQLNGNGQLMNDFTYATAKFAGQNLVTIFATDASTVQPDPGSSPTDLGILTVSRGGFPLRAMTVNLALSTGAGFATEGVDHLVLPRTVTLAAGVSMTNISVTPMADTNLHSSVLAKLSLLPNANYSIGANSNAAVVIYPSQTPNGTGLTGIYYTNSSPFYATITNFNATNLFLTRVDPQIDFTWTNGTSPNLSNGLYSVRWLGQVQPQYSETYFFDMRSDDGCKLWVNDQLISDNWKAQGVVDVIATPINLQAGTRYNIKLEYYQGGTKGEAHLFWYSASQSKQIIPTTRLYPTNSPAAPSTITSLLNAYAFLGQPFSFNVTGANTPLNFSAIGLPPGLSFNVTNGLISGVPSLAGDYQVTLTASNTVGLGASLVDILVIDSGSSVVREVWTGIVGTNISDIPLTTPATVTNVLGALEGITNFGANYGERIRGYLTAPVTGNYYFWIAGSDSAELWISNDKEPVNKLKRANVSPANGGTLFHAWNSQTNQQTKWLALNAGQKYYVEILHKAGTTPNDHWSVAWLQDPTGTNTVPSGVVPGYVLSRYYPQPIAIASGTLYTANMLALPGINSTAVGSATLLVSADGSQAVLNYSVNGLTNSHVDHIYSDPYLMAPTTLLYDIAAAHPQSDGSYLWKIKSAGSLTNADILEILIEGKASIVIQTPANPAGEIGGHFTLANGAQIFNAPPAPPAFTDDHANTNADVRFLAQATFGASSADIASVQSLGYTAWISNQFSLPATHALPVAVNNQNPDPSNPFPSADWFNAWWQNSVTAPDQLRQRVAFALSEIMVISDNGTLLDHADALSSYYDTLVDNCFGNYRALLKAVTLTPAMGVYLNMQGNSKGNIVNGTHANENYAREINQLFSIGLNREWPDGSLVLNSQNSLVPTYNQNVINGFAQTFTGWNYFQTNQASGRLPSGFGPPVNWTNPMVLVPSQHDLNSKLLLDNVVLPPALGNAAVNNTSTNDNYSSQDLEQALDSIFNNPNVGPFICRELIQRLVTSNPSRDYLYRVVQKFNDNGGGVRGDMQAVIKAILLDPAARGTNSLGDITFGKQREPLLRVTEIARAFPAPTNQNATYAESGTQIISITTPAPHRMNNGDIVALNFTDTSGQPAPPGQNYSITYVSPNTFNVSCPNLLGGTYTQTNGVITVNMNGHGLAADDLCYLVFASGSGVTKRYQVLSAPTGNQFTVATTNNAGSSGNCVMPKLSAAGYVQSGNLVTVTCAAAHGLVANELFYVPANNALLTPNIYSVSTVIDPTHFTFLANANNTTQSGFSLYPLGSPPPPLTRSGNALVQWSTWNMGATDTDPTYNLGQSPLSANTVFNFFFPGYEFPGALSSAGLTTPEFQLTSDTSVALQMNFLQAGILGNGNNTNGLSSYNNGNGALILDLGPWMTTNFTASANVPLLVDNLNSLLLAGQLSNAAKTNIINYVTNVTNFPFGTPPTQSQMRDRVRAVVHLIVCSPDFTIQK